MTAIPAFAFSAMDHTAHDENMDFASDMPAHDADFDFDLPDASRGSSAEPIQDVMIEDMQETTHFSEIVQTSAKEGADDDMLDEELTANERQGIDESMGNGEDGQNSATMYDDEDLIYEDDDGIGKTEEEIDDVYLQETVLPAEEPASNEKSENVSREATIEQQHEHQSIHGDGDSPGSEHPGDALEPRSNDVAIQEPGTSAQELDNDTTGLESAEFVDNSNASVVEQEASEDLDASVPQYEEVSAEQATIDQAKTPGLEAAGDTTFEKTESPPTTSDQANEPGQGELESTTETQDEYESQVLHPVKVQYDGAELSLFPPLDGDDTFFVQDSSLAFSSCHQLLTVCREVLGDSIRTDHELVLDFPSLGLHLTEGSSHTSELTVAQILDVYLTLRQNEHAEAVPPLHCILRTRISLTSQYAFLLAAAENGKTLDSLHSDYSDRFKLPEKSSDAPAHIVEESADQSAESKQDIGDGSIENPASAYAEGEWTDPTVLAPAEENDGNLDARSDISSELDLGPEVDDSASHEDQSKVTAQNPESVDAAVPVSDNRAGNSEANIESVSPVLDVVKDTAPGSNRTDKRSFTGNASEGISVADFASNDPSYSVADLANGNFPDIENDTTAQSSSAADEQDYDVYEENDATDELNPGDEDDSALVGEDSTELPNPSITAVLPEDSFVAAAEDDLGEDVYRSAAGPDGDDSEQTLANEDVTNSKSANNDEIIDSLNTDDEDDILSLTNEAHLNGQSYKRKLQDEDDFGLIDPSTPEKKKRRPS